VKTEEDVIIEQLIAISVLQILTVATTEHAPSRATRAAWSTWAITLTSWYGSLHLDLKKTMGEANYGPSGLI
jgi:hypothetical protein